MNDHSLSGKLAKLLAWVIACSLFSFSAWATDKLQLAASISVRKTSPYHSVKLTESAKDYYTVAWGVDNLKVGQTASGNLIRFSYRVIEPALAKALGDNKATPYLYGQRSRAVLEVPVMDKIGQLRQTNTVEAGKEYWMVFSNKGNLVRPGDRVNVMIGSFHVDGLMVE
jgi:hypothetical protein